MYLKNEINIRLFVVFLVIMAGSMASLGQENVLPEKDQPKVTRAVAPTFIPFVFEETGVAEIVVEVKIDSDGKVISAKTSFASLFKDISFENTAKQWIFEKSMSSEERTAYIKFILRIMPKETNPSELTTIYRCPSEIEVRNVIFPSQITTGPLPDKEKPKKKKKPKLKSL